MLEKQLEKKCCDWAEKQGWWQRKFVSPSQRGVPDRLFLREGFVVFIEFKRAGEKPTALQVKTIGDMHKHGATVHVVDNFETFKMIMGGQCG